MERRSFLRSSSLAALATLVPAHSLLAKPWLDTDTRLREAEDKALTTIAFGSCNRVQRDQSYWKLVTRDAPDLWIWLGDNIYADRTTLEERRARYQMLTAHPFYQEFCRRTPVIATWDDHDYGSDNDDGSLPYKEESKQLFLDWQGYDQASPLRRQNGIYQTRSFGPSGRRTDVVMLDLRYNMNRSLAEPTLLGEEQWSWLEAVLTGSTADLIVIGSSLNVSSPVASSLIGLEGWQKYGQEKQRLYELLSRLPQTVITLSGDRHFAELYQIVLPNGRIAYEAMSSGLTHAVGVKLPHPGRLAEMVGTKNYGLLKIDWSTPGRPQVRMQIASAESYGVLREALIS